MTNIAIYPGTFDPITNGHMDIAHRACKLFDKVIVAIAPNNKKQPLFTLEERIHFAEEVFKNTPNVEIKGFNTLLVNFAKLHGANLLLRGLRAVSDFDYEFQLAAINRSLAPELETIFLTPEDNHTYISSSFIREIASLGGEVDKFVPACVAKALHQKFSHAK